MPEPIAIGEFLKARRGALRPADVGLPEHGRRRTPGLRREEVAALAGVSIDYLVRLEQGRDRNPSWEVLDALATALRLSSEERDYLLEVSMCEKAKAMPSTRHHSWSAPVVPSGVAALLDRLDPTPAVIVGPWLDVLAANATWRQVVRPLGMLEGDPPNLARHTFSPAGRRTHRDWDAVADDHAGRLRSATVRWGGAPALVELIEELSADPDFAERWRSQSVERLQPRTMSLHHPAGPLRIEVETLLVPAAEGLRLLTWLPADARTASAFDAAGAHPGGHLRLVGRSS